MTGFFNLKLVSTSKYDEIDIKLLLTLKFGCVTIVLNSIKFQHINIPKFTGSRVSYSFFHQLLENISETLMAGETFSPTFFRPTRQRRF